MASRGATAAMGFPVLRPLRGALALLAFLGVVPLLPAQTGYGYRKGQDPMVLSVKKIVLAARRDRWAEAVEEAGKLEWFFKEIREDLRVDLGKDFREAAGSRSLGRLSDEIARLVYFAVVQKFHWNEKEELKVFTRSKARADAALEYYEEILAIGVRAHDERQKGERHSRILRAFAELRKSLGSSGLFGLRARPPDLESFRARRREIEGLLAEVYPQVKPAKPAEAPSAKSGS